MHHLRRRIRNHLFEETHTKSILWEVANEIHYLRCIRNQLFVKMHKKPLFEKMHNRPLFQKIYKKKSFIWHGAYEIVYLPTADIQPLAEYKYTDLAHFGCIQNHLCETVRTKPFIWEGEYKIHYLRRDIQNSLFEKVHTNHFIWGEQKTFICHVTWNTVFAKMHTK